MGYWASWPQCHGKWYKHVLRPAYGIWRVWRLGAGWKADFVGSAVTWGWCADLDSDGRWVNFWQCSSQCDVRSGSIWACAEEHQCAKWWHFSSSSIFWWYLFVDMGLFGTYIRVSFGVDDSVLSIEVCKDYKSVELSDWSWFTIRECCERVEFVSDIVHPALKMTGKAWKHRLEA